MSALTAGPGLPPPPRRSARPARRRALAAGLAFALALPAYALPGDETLLLDLCINDRCVGVAPVIARGDDVLVDREALGAAGIDVTGVAPEHLGERDFVSLRALNHGSTFAIDRTLLRLDLRLRPERLPHQTASMATRVRTERASQAWTAFANYAITAGDQDERNLFLDVAVGRGNAALRTTGGWDGTQGWQRGLTRFEFDETDALRRWTLGDQYALPRDPLGGGQLLGGAGVERAFDQDPYLVTFPQPYYSGVLEAPGTVEVYANGTLIGRSELAAGPFTLEQLGVQPGRNDVRVIVRDPLGNRSELATQSYYGGSPRLLAAGLSEYAVRIGAPRDDGGYGDGHYDDRVAMQAWYRRGLGAMFTLGGRVEGDARMHNAGVDAAVRTPLGEFAFAAAASDDDLVGRGDAYSANYSFSTRVWSVGFGTLRASADYRRLADASTFASVFGMPRETDYASVSFSPAARLSLQLNAGRQRRDGFAAERTAGFTATWQVASRAQVLFAVQRFESAGVRDTAAQVSLNLWLDRDSLTVAARRNDTAGQTHDGYSLDARRSRPADTGFGYAANVQRNDGSDSAFGQLDYQGRHGRYALEAEDFDGSTHARAIASGALVVAGGRWFATPPVDSGFALVRVPGLANVPILRENIEIGRTDADGDLLVRGLLPYYANRISLDASAVPTSYALDAEARSVQVARNTGSVVVLDARVLRAVTGHFRYAAGEAGDVATVAGGETEVPVGSGGLFYFEGLPAGRSTATILRTQGSVSCTFDVPAAGAGVADLGDVACTEAR
jgi:outer membrane usher protein